jgi:hypothetical protein
MSKTAFALAVLAAALGVVVATKVAKKVPALG